MEANESQHGYVKATQALVTGAASIVGVLVLIATMDSWPVLPHVCPIILAIVGVAAIIGAVWKPLAWYLAACVGAAVGFACAFAVATYAVSKI
jgi:uncharacterized membrane protein HdeD (DUF308 family)